MHQTSSWTMRERDEAFKLFLATLYWRFNLLEGLTDSPEVAIKGERQRDCNPNDALTPTDGDSHG